MQSWSAFFLAHNVFSVKYFKHGLCLKCWMSPDEDKLTGKIDLIICLGGDGTLLYASTLFQVKWLTLSRHICRRRHRRRHLYCYSRFVIQGCLKIFSPMFQGLSFCVTVWAIGFVHRSTYWLWARPCELFDCPENWSRFILCRSLSTSSVIFLRYTLW